MEAVGVTTMVVVVCPEGSQLYDTPPEAVSVAEDPLHIVVEAGLMLMVLVFTVITASSVALQLAYVYGSVKVAVTE